MWLRLIRVGLIVVESMHAGAQALGASVHASPSAPGADPNNGVASGATYQTESQSSVLTPYNQASHLTPSMPCVLPLSLA